MNILILNWRDPKNPKSGGAEKLNMHILKPLLDDGNSVLWYSMSVGGLPKKETYNGVTIVRFGNPLTHLIFWPFLYWMGKFGNPDLIIDSIHGTGYLSSLVSPAKQKVILICEVAQNIWDEMYPFPINSIGRFWEKIMFKFYNDNKFWTISDSTKKDLIEHGVKKENIIVLPMGFDGVKLEKVPSKSTEPTALFVGRLAEMKGVKDAIMSIAEVNKSLDKKWNLRIIGRGEKDYEHELKNLVNKLNLNDYISFIGYVDESTKFEEMAKAWVLLVPSSREGWGMIVPEANSVGTPAIGYNVPGLSEVMSKYSPQNRIVEKGYKQLVDELGLITTPPIIKKTITSGWDDLYTFIREYSIK